MASGWSIGTIFVELDLDPTRYMKSQRTLLREAQNASGILEKNFANLGIKSDATFDMMKMRAKLSFEAIRDSGRATANDLIKAQKAYALTVNQIYREQFEQEKNLNQKRAAMSRDSAAGWLSMMKGMLAYRVILAGITTATQSFMGTFKYLETIETATLGIAASLSTAGKFVDATTGKTLRGYEAIKAAQGMSKEIIEELRIANLQTIATLDELIVAYQNTLPVAMAKGFNVKQVKDFTLAMVQAAGAIGLPMNQLAEETRSMLTGTINPRTSRIATVLGLRNEDIARYKNDAQGLFDFLMDKLKQYKVAGIEAQTTWSGLWSNMKDLAFQYLGEGMKPLFDTIKRELIAITEKIIVVDKKTGTIKWNPEFLESMKTFKSAMTLVIADFRRLVMLVDLFGVGLALAAKAATFGLSKTINDMAKTFEERFYKGEEFLMDLAMAEENYKRATKETPGAISQETPYGKRELWYVKEIGKATTYNANARKEDADEAKKAAEERIRLIKLETDLVGKQMAAREEYEKQVLSATEAADSALRKFVEKELTGEAKALAEVDRKMEDVNAKLREKYGITAETIEIDKDYLAELKELIAAGEERKRQIIETGIQQEISNDKVLKSLDDMYRAAEAAETGYEEDRMSPHEREDYFANRHPLQRSFEAALKWGDSEHAIQFLNEGLAEHYQKLRDATDAANLFQEAWNLINMSTQGYMNQLVDATLEAFNSMEDAIVDFVMTGKNSFKDFANSVLADMVRIATRAAVIQPLAQIVGSFWPAFGSAANAYGGARAGGGPVSGGVSYLVGERGPELFVPSTSGAITPNSGKGNVTVNITNKGQPVDARVANASFDARGWVIDVVLDGLNRNVGGLRTALGGA